MNRREIGNRNHCRGMTDDERADVCGWFYAILIASLAGGLLMGMLYFLGWST